MFRHISMIWPDVMNWNLQAFINVTLLRVLQCCMELSPLSGTCIASQPNDLPGALDKKHQGFNDDCRFRWLFPVKVNNLLWWASLLMFTGATAFNVSTIASCLLGDVPENWTTTQEVNAAALC